MLSPEELIRVTNAVRHWDALTSPSAESAMTQLTDLLARIRDALGSGTTDAGEVSARIAALVPAEVKQGIPGFLDRHGLAANERAKVEARATEAHVTALEELLGRGAVPLPALTETWSTEVFLAWLAHLQPRPQPLVAMLGEFKVWWTALGDELVGL